LIVVVGVLAVGEVTKLPLSSMAALVGGSGFAIAWASQQVGGTVCGRRWRPILIIIIIIIIIITRNMLRKRPPIQGPLFMEDPPRISEP
jgi:hypothetical protein